MQRAIFTILLACAMPSYASAQVPDSYTPTLTFDVASVRQAPPADSFSVSFQNPMNVSLTRLTNNSAINLLSIAYGVDRAQIKGLPGWTDGLYFNVEGKADAATDQKLASMLPREAYLEKQHMLQVLFAERFHLVTHWEEREGLAYDLVVAKTGPKLLPAGSAPPSAEELKNFGENKIPTLYQRGDGARGYEFFGHACTLVSLAGTLTSQMSAPVVDKTALTGTYDFTLQYSGAQPTERNERPGVWPAITDALPEQLGLRLVAGKGPRRYLIVDRMEHPSDN